MDDGRNWREQRVLDALHAQGSLTCWETRTPSRKTPGKHHLTYEIDIEGASNKTIATLLAEGLVRFEFESEVNGIATGKLHLTD
jgi:hypothetical protein